MKISLTGLLDDGTPRRAGVPSPQRTISFVRGADVEITVTVLTPMGTPVSLTGGSLLLSVKRRAGEHPPRISKPATIAGVVGTFTLTPTDTRHLQAGKWIYDVWLTTGIGKRDAVIPASQLILTDSVADVPA